MYRTVREKMMQYKMPFQVIDSVIHQIIVRESRKQKLSLVRMNTSHITQLAAMGKAIREEGLPEHLLCKKLPHHLGYGIFLHPRAKPLAQGVVIAPYTGKILFLPQNSPEDALYAFEPLSRICLTRVEQLLFHSGAKYHPRRLYSLHIDAEKGGNFTRFINHSERPNVVAELVRIPSNSLGVPESPLSVVYFTHKRIEPGEQLLVSYDGDDHSYWGALDIKPFPLLPKTFYLRANRGSIQMLRNPG